METEQILRFIVCFRGFGYINTDIPFIYNELKDLGKCKTKLILTYHCYVFSWYNTYELGMVGQAVNRYGKHYNANTCSA